MYVYISDGDEEFYLLSFLSGESFFFLSFQSPFLNVFSGTSISKSDAGELRERCLSFLLEKLKVCLLLCTLSCYFWLEALCTFIYPFCNALIMGHILFLLFFFFFLILISNSWFSNSSSCGVFIFLQCHEDYHS
jgi:hypothetical protein